MKNKSLQECLNYIQVNLKAPKNMKNSFGGYSYRNLEGIFEGLKQLLEETDCIVTVNDEMELLGDRYYIRATAKISKGNESISCDGWARESEDRKGMDLSQISGACSSYAAKYSASHLFLIDDNQDADSRDNTYTITDGQKAMYQELLNSGAYEGEKQKINKWWKTLTTEQQAQAGLVRMQDHVDNYKEKHNEKG